MTDILIEFPGRSQELGPLRAAAYRVMARAACQIDSTGEVHLCRLTPKSAKADLEDLRLHFLDLVTDENLRGQIAAETAGTRNVILALAFGALAAADGGGDT